MGSYRTMNSYSPNMTAEELILESKLSEISRVPPWIERLASLHAISSDTQFAMDLCLEEVISNIIRHGYSSNADGVIRVQYLAHRDGFSTLVVEDEAPSFNPLVINNPPLPRSLEETTEGGRGIPLLKEFADEVEYQPKPIGNRLILKFLSPGSSRAAI